MCLVNRHRTLTMFNKVIATKNTDIAVLILTSWSPTRVAKHAAYKHATANDPAFFRRWGRNDTNSATQNVRHLAFIVQFHYCWGGRRVLYMNTHNTYVLTYE